ncbi:MAG: ribosome recycling factor [Bacteroidetes bacterium]|nr:MAG: ribosome recycling factor [Bacteroidota bacterium]RLD69065.1 MAG: ribosome recycling factor [Bacteroidota bacterium]RLD92328.1 MAG: ribosome recycling factor [Bacteroidota bacterium]
MNEEVQMVYEMAKENMEKTIEHLDNELMRIRAGKANVHILDGVMVDYYGTPTPLNQVSNISTPDAKTIMIQPWEKSMIEPIEKALMVSNVGITPGNNGEVIRLVVPQLTEERRVDLVKQVKNEGENARVSVRNARREANDEYKNMQKDGLSEDETKTAEDDIQKLTDEFTEKVEKIVEAKDQDIMTI